MAVLGREKGGVAAAEETRARRTGQFARLVVSTRIRLPLIRTQQSSLHRFIKIPQTAESRGCPIAPCNLCTFAATATISIVADRKIGSRIFALTGGGQSEKSLQSGGTSQGLATFSWLGFPLVPRGRCRVYSLWYVCNLYTSVLPPHPSLLYRENKEAWWEVGKFSFEQADVPLFHDLTLKI